MALQKVGRNETGATACHNCGRTVADDFDLCHDCMTTLVKNLESVPGLVSDILITRSRQDRMSSNLARGKSAETALPIRLDQYDQRPTQRPFDALTNELITWARDLDALIGGELDAALDSRGLRDIVHRHRHSRRPDPASLSQDGALDAELASIWLSLYADDLRRHPAVAELFDGIEDAIARCRKAIDRLPELSYKGPCPHVSYDEERQPFTCSADLYVERGEDYVSCPRCWTHHRVRDLERDRLSEIDDRLFTLPETSRLLDALDVRVAQSTLYDWVQKGELKPRGWKQADGSISNYWIRRSDPAVYMLKEVREVAARHAPRQE